MAPRVRATDPQVDPVMGKMGTSGLASFILSTGLVCKLMPAGGSQACRGLAACLSCHDKGLLTQLHFVWFMTSQVALSRRGTSPREWEVVVTLSDHPVAACSVDFPVCPVWLGIKLGVAGIGTTVQCAVAGERMGVLVPGLTFFGSVGGKLDLHFGCQEVALREYPLVKRDQSLTLALSNKQD